MSAAVWRVINEEELELVAAIRLGEFQVVDSVSWLVLWHVALESFKGCVAGSGVFNFDSVLGVVNLEDQVSVGAFHSKVGEHGDDFL